MIGLAGVCIFFLSTEGGILLAEMDTFVNVFGIFILVFFDNNPFCCKSCIVLLALLYLSFADLADIKAFDAQALFFKSLPPSKL